MANRRPSRARNPIRVIIVVVGLLLAANIWIVAGVSQRTNTEPLLPSALEELVPKPGDLVSPATTIGVNLRDDYTGALKFDGSEIPEDQTKVQTDGIITFTPGPGTDLSKLPQGSHTITVIYWPRASTREKAATSYSWTFKVGA